MITHVKSTFNSSHRTFQVSRSILLRYRHPRLPLVLPNHSLQQNQQSISPWIRNALRSSLVQITTPPQLCLQLFCCLYTFSCIIKRFPRIACFPPCFYEG